MCIRGYPCINPPSPSVLIPPLLATIWDWDRGFGGKSVLIEGWWSPTIVGSRWFAKLKIFSRFRGYGSPKLKIFVLKISETQDYFSNHGQPSDFKQKVLQSGIEIVWRKWRFQILKIWFAKTQDFFFEICKTQDFILRFWANHRGPTIIGLHQSSMELFLSYATSLALPVSS